MYDKILVPVDGSECALAAVDHAGRLADTFDATVQIVSVADVRLTFGRSPTAGDAASVVDYAKARCEQAVETAVERLADTAPDVAVDSTVLVGIPMSEIVDYVAQNDVDVVVMGTHGRSGFDRLLLGSVAEGVMRTAPAPVYLVPATD